MNEVIILHESRPQQILQAVLDEKVSAIMSYLSGGNWRLNRVLLTTVRPDSFDVKITPLKKTFATDIQPGRSVGISFKYGFGREYDKFVFGTQVISLKSSGAPGNNSRIALAMPQDIELVQRRSYFRIPVPKSLKVEVEFWNRESENHELVLPQDRRNWHGELVDISAGGMQIAINAAEAAQFRKGLSIGLCFTPIPNETPLMFNTKIKNISPTADDKSICLGLQMIGLEASPEGRLILQRLCNTVEEYRRLDQP